MILINNSKEWVLICYACEIVLLSCWVLAPCVSQSHPVMCPSPIVAQSQDWVCTWGWYMIIKTEDTMVHVGTWVGPAYPSPIM